jgi:retron-type reverse transcriptase
MLASTQGRIERCRRSGSIFRRRMADSGRSASLPLEDKIVQAAVVAILTPIYEAEFLGFSYGFRPKRTQHQALDALAFGIGKRRINWVLDCDVQSFFDKVSQDWLIRFVEHRVGDRRIIRLIAKWLTAGVLEDGRVIEAEEGTPQGAVISPLLANIYLHHVYDQWVHQWRQRCIGFLAGRKRGKISDESSEMTRTHSTRRGPRSEQRSGNFR